MGKRRLSNCHETASMKDYQYNFSEMHQDIYFDAESRGRKADKMLRILRDHLGQDLRTLEALDIGCSTGAMTKLLGEHFGRVTGIDIDTKAIEYAQTNLGSSKLDFRIGDAMETGLPADSMDVVICAHVYEHVPDASRMMTEIHRLLRPGGVCYFAAENKFVFREGDYRLPFLSILPKFLAHRYLRLAGRGDHYYEELYTYWRLERITGAFERIDYTRHVVKDPQRFGAGDIIRDGSFQQRAALSLIDHAYWLFPTYLWLLQKRQGSGPQDAVSPRLDRPSASTASHNSMTRAASE